MQANPNGDRVSDRVRRKGAREAAAARRLTAFDKLPEYAYRAAILVAMVLLLWTAA
jgi:hypothetical protein